jgi:transposase
MNYNKTIIEGYINTNRDFMGRKLTLPDGFDGYDFLKTMRKMKHGRNRIRLLAMHHIQLGKSLKMVSKIVQSHWVTVQKWLKKFKADGFDGLYESQRSGAPRKIQKEEEECISEKLSTLSAAKAGGYITGNQIHQILIDKYNIKCCLKTVYNSVHKLKFSWITSRSIHPKSNLETQDKYKKTLLRC